MSKKANPTLVGGFVVGALALTLAGIVVVGGGDFFQEEFECVAYFDDSVAGLDIGAPIRFNGVSVGTVSTVRAVWSEDEATPVRIPVGLSFVKDAVHAPSKEVAERLAELGVYEVMESMVQRGLRAELQQDSFVTGKLFVALRFEPGTPIRRVGAEEPFEIPTIQGSLAKLQKSLQDLPIAELLDEAIATLDAIQARVNDPAVDELFATLNRVTGKLEGEATSLAESARNALDEVGGLAQSVDAELTPAVQDLRRVLDSLEADFGALSGSATGVFDEARALLRKITDAGGEYTLVYRFTSLLDQMSEAARALRVLADYLERHPEALLSGKAER